MDRVLRAWAWLEAFWLAPVAGHAVFVTRVAYGLIMAWAYLELFPYVPALFGPSGLAGIEAIESAPGFVGIDFMALGHFRVLQHVRSMFVIWLLYGLLIVASLTLAVGLVSRTSAVVVVGLHLIFVAHVPHVFGGWAWMIHVFIIYLVLSNPGAAVSVDAWWRRRRRGGSADAATELLVPAAGLRLLQLHVVTMYLVAGWERLDAPAWLDGEMVFRALADTSFARFDLNLIAFQPLLRLLNYTVYVLEPAAPLLLLVPKLRKVGVVLLVAMHAGLELTMDVGFWQLVMIASLTVFMPTGWLAKLLRLAEPESEET